MPPYTPTASRVILAILYLRAQDSLYLDYLTDLRLLAGWLLEGEAEETTIPLDSLPDVCGICGFQFPWTQGGRMRYGCPICPPGFPFTKQQVRFYWAFEFASIFRCREGYLEACFAMALTLIH